MCEPTTIAMGVAAVASAYSAYSQAQQANAAAKTNAKRNNAVTEANYKRQMLDAQYQEKDIQKNTAASIDANYLNTLKAADTAKVRAGASGIQGNSVNALLSDIKGQGAANAFNIQQNAEGAMGQMGRDKNAAQQNAASQLYTPQKINSNWQSQLVIGGANVAANYYTKSGTVAKKTVNTGN